MTESDNKAIPRGALWELVKGSSSARGEELFLELTRGLAEALEVRFAVLSEVTGRPHHLRTLAAWAGDTWLENFDYDLEGTPCGRVVETGEAWFCGDRVGDHFPEALHLQNWQVHSYLGTPLRSASGEVIGTLCVFHTESLDDDRRARVILEPFATRAAVELERLRAEREVETQHAFLRQILDINPSFIFVKDREGRFTLVNKAVSDAYGTTIQGLTGKTDADFNPKEEEVAFFRKMDLEVMDTKRERFIPEEPVTDATGRVRWVQTIKRPIVGEDGRADQVLGVSTDITELKRTKDELLEAQLQEHQKVQDELAKVKDELVRQTRLATIGQVAATIAHELRNPLGAINNAVFILRRQPKVEALPKWSENLGIIAQEVRTADRIINDLLEMTRAKTPQKEPVDLGVVAQDAFDRARGDTKVDFRLNLQPSPFMVDADPSQLGQVLTNLLTNAIQAMPRGGEITLEARHEGGFDLLTLTDQGPGVPPGLQAKIFEPLFTTKAKGTGLGLAICRQIIERHAGMIWLAPSKRGAAIRIRIPARLSSSENSRD